MSEAEVIATPLGPARLRRSGRKTLAITVQPDGALELTAPARTRIEEILSKISKRASWIRRQQREFAAMNGRRPLRRYCSGATLRYLGRQYRFKATRGATPSVKLRGAFLSVVTREGTEREVEQQVGIWMRSRAQDQLERRLDQWREWCRRQHLPLPRIQLRSMPKRWGSAQPDGRIWFNPELVRAPSICIDYVVAHEICHLKHPNHGPAFYRQLSEFVPDWRRIKLRLECAEM